MRKTSDWDIVSGSMKHYYLVPAVERREKNASLICSARKNLNITCTFYKAIGTITDLGRKLNDVGAAEYEGSRCRGDGSSSVWCGG